MPKPSANAVNTPLVRPLAAFAAAALLGCIPYGNTLCWECAENDEECKKAACPSYTESDTATGSDTSTTTETGTTTSTMTTSTTSMTTTSTTTDATTTEDTTSTTTGGPCNYDLACDADEDADDCLHDCGVCDEDGVCDDATETPYSCPADCPASGCNSDGMVDALTEQCDDGNAEDGDACTSECAHAVCGDGYLFSTENGGTEECDDGNVDDNDGCASDCTVEHRTVFVTSVGLKGNFGGLEAADTQCQTLAASAGLEGTYMAWLSDANSGPSDRFGVDPQFSGVFELVDATEIAVGWPDLVDGNLASPIQLNEMGEDMGSSSVWTKTLANGTPDKDEMEDIGCMAWTVDDGGNNGSIGLSNRSDETWTKFATTQCSNTPHFYCFQVQ